MSLTLGIETSCDETSAALVEGGTRVLSNVVSSQVELHREYGGVVPELAARSHLERLPLVVDEAFRAAGVALSDVDLVAVTRGPGLVGALLVGVGFASGLALDRGLPIVGVSHLDGHVHSAFLKAPDLQLPMLVLLVSGGHTELVLMSEDGGYTVLGRTRDDAAGEAFDKVARLLGLPYPGGPEIQRVADGIDVSAARRTFPLPRIDVDGLDFSFSGIKTAVRYRLESQAGRAHGSGVPTDLEPGVVAAGAASFQDRVVEHLTGRVNRALDTHVVRTLALAGGVAMNGPLRRALTAVAIRRNEHVPGGPTLAVVIPDAGLCTDNAAMIAAAGYALHARGLGTALEVDPGLRLAD